MREPEQAAVLLFAGVAMHAIVGSPQVRDANQIAKFAFEIGDAMVLRAKAYGIDVTVLGK